METDEHQGVERSAWKGWRVLALAGGLLLALVVTAFAGAAAYLLFQLDTCGLLDDTGGGGYAAIDSPQGQLCGRASPATWLEDLGAWAFPAASAVALVLLILAWRRGGTVARTAAAAGLVMLPLLTVVALNLPPDTCTDEVKQRPRAECEPSE